MEVLTAICDVRTAENVVKCKGSKRNICLEYRSSLEGTAA